jgi:hypothetical protein
LANIRILHTIIIDDPFENPAGIVSRENSPEKIKEKGRLEYEDLEEILNEEKAKDEETVLRENQK